MGNYPTPPSGMGENQTAPNMEGIPNSPNVEGMLILPSMVGMATSPNIPSVTGGSMKFKHPVLPLQPGMGDIPAQPNTERTQTAPNPSNMDGMPTQFIMPALSGRFRKYPPAIQGVPSSIPSMEGLPSHPNGPNMEGKPTQPNMSQVENIPTPSNEPDAPFPRRL